MKNLQYKTIRLKYYDGFSEKLVANLNLDFTTSVRNLMSALKKSSSPMYQETRLRHFLFWGHFLTWGQVSTEQLQKVYQPDDGFVQGLSVCCDHFNRENRIGSYYKKIGKGSYKIIKSESNFYPFIKQPLAKHFNFKKVRERAYRIKDNNGKFTI